MERPSFDVGAVVSVVAYAFVSALSASLRFDEENLPVVFGAVAPVIYSPAVAVVCSPFVPRLYRKLGRTRMLALLLSWLVCPSCRTRRRAMAIRGHGRFGHKRGRRRYTISFTVLIGARFITRRVAPLHAPPRSVAHGARRLLISNEVARHGCRRRLYYQMVRYRRAINRSNAHRCPAVVAQAAAAAADRRRRGLRRAIGGAAAVALLNRAARLPSPRRAAHVPAAESGLCPRERRRFRSWWRFRKSP